MSKRFYHFFILIIAMVILTGCAPIYVSYIANDYYERGNNKITLLPIIDARQDTKHSYTGYVSKMMKKRIISHGYSITESNVDITIPDQVNQDIKINMPAKINASSKKGKELYGYLQSDAKIRSISPEVIKSIQPDNSGLIGIIKINEVKRSYWFIGASSRANISMFVFDPKKGDLMCYSNAFGDYSSAPASILLPPLMVICTPLVFFPRAGNMAIDLSSWIAVLSLPPFAKPTTEKQN